MAVIRVPTSFNIDVEFEIPEFFRRIMALVIDIIVQYLYLRIADSLYSAIASNWGSGNQEDLFQDLSAIGSVLLLPVLLYHLLLEITLNGQTVGKKILGMRVVNEHGGRPAISQFLIRWLLRISDLWIFIILIYLIYWASGMQQNGETVFLLIGGFSFLLADIIMVIVSKKNQRIGDLLARTIVIRTKQKASIDDTVFREVTESYVPKFPEVMRLSDRDLNAVRSILTSSRKKMDYQVAHSAANKIKQHLLLQSDMDPFDFLETLLTDYNALSAK